MMGIQSGTTDTACVLKEQVTHYLKKLCFYSFLQEIMLIIEAKRNKAVSGREVIENQWKRVCKKKMP